MRRGAAIVELAVCLPVLVLIVLASIEAAGLIFARQAMVQTAYEAAVVAIQREATNDLALSAARQVTSGRNFRNVTIRFQPADVSRVPRGTAITVTAEIPSSEARTLSSRLIAADVISANATMIKE